MNMGVDVHDMDVKGLGSDTEENVIRCMEPLGESLHILTRTIPSCHSPLPHLIKNTRS